MFENCGIHCAVIVEVIMQVRSGDFHVLRSAGRLGPVRELHCHVCHLVVMRRCAFCKEANVFPFKAQVEFHVMDLLTDVCIPCCLGIGYCVADVMVKMFAI